MAFKTIPLEEVDIRNETFRISEELDSAPVLDSIREIGQLNPVLLLDQQPLKIIVCGFRRIRALKKLGKSQVLIRILSKNGFKALQGFDLSLWDNLAHRRLSSLEKARFLSKLQNICGLPKDTVAKTYLPLLELPPHESVLDAHLKLNGIHPALRRCLLEERLTHSSAESLSGMPYSMQQRVALLMDKIRLSASLQRKVLAILEELSAMSGAEMDAPLENAEVLSVLSDSRLSPFQKGEKLHEILYRIRNPRLSEAVERFKFSKKQLDLPGSIRIQSHPFFETADLHVEFEASNAKRFRELAAALEKASQSPELDKLFRVV
jgi:hypothetical protein